MSFRARIALVVMWLTSLVAVGVWASAQTPQGIVRPVVMSGNDIGFRVEGQCGNARIGTLVVRISGRWVEAQTAVKPINLTAK